MLHRSSSRCGAPAAQSAAHTHRWPVVREQRTRAPRTWPATMAMQKPDQVDTFPALVSPAWLKERLDSVVVLDTSWYLPPMGRAAAAEHAAGRIPGARFWDVDGVCDPGSSLPHMLPSEAAFAAAADALGITSPATPLVLYDGLGMFAAPRAWWTWRVFGHERVAVLQGGLPAWRAAGGEIDASSVDDATLHAATAAARHVRGTDLQQPHYPAQLKRDKVYSLADMQALVAPVASALAAGEPAPALVTQVLDARPGGRFRGADPEPRKELPSGHMPGSTSMPFTQVYTGRGAAGLDGATLAPREELVAAFASAGVDVHSPVVCSCGSGLTACILALALHEVTGQLAAVYDGSWCEWAATPGAAIVSDV